MRTIGGESVVLGNFGGDRFCGGKFQWGNITYVGSLEYFVFVGHIKKYTGSLKHFIFCIDCVFVCVINSTISI